MLEPPTDGGILVAVSGGSDSLALLYQLIDDIPRERLLVATVNHDLRTEALEEAEYVGKIATGLGLPHEILTWQHNKQRSGQSDGKSAENARLARYELLAGHARKSGADTIALGHTLDDQAETVLMRALRAQPNTATMGLSGMHQLTAYDDLILWRPLLTERREDLRIFLRQRHVEWIDDPTNTDTSSERVRIRMALAADQVPTAPAIARLAALAQRERLWLGHHAAMIIRTRVKKEGNCDLILNVENDVPRRLIQEVLALLIMTVGGIDYRPSVTKFVDCVDAAMQNKRFKKSVGRALIRVEATTIYVEREARHVKTPPTGLYLSLNRFRVASDDDVHAAIAGLIGVSRST